MCGLCYLWLVLLPCCNAGGLDVAEFPSDQNADKQKNREPYAHRQGFDHLVRFGLTVTAIAHHEHQGRDQAAENG